MRAVLVINRIIRILLLRNISKNLRTTTTTIKTAYHSRNRQHLHVNLIHVTIEFTQALATILQHNLTRFAISRVNLKTIKIIITTTTTIQIGSLAIKRTSAEYHPIHIFQNSSSNIHSNNDSWNTIVNYKRKYLVLHKEVIPQKTLLLQLHLILLL